jgi:hypothetical protein
MTEQFGMNQQDVVDAAEPLLLSRDLTDIERALERAHKAKARFNADPEAAELARRIDPEGFTPEMLQAQIDSSVKQGPRPFRGCVRSDSRCTATTTTR